MENNKSKPRWKLNIFDIIIIAAVIVAAGVIIFIWRNSGKSSNTAATYSVRYTIELSGMLEGTSEKIKVGDTVMDSTKNFIMGTVTNLMVEPATKPEPNYETGDTVQSVLPGRETALIELACDCSSTESQITASSGYSIRIGSEVTAAGPGYAGKGYVVAINREDLGQ
jgi:hypothetical protein